MAPTCYVIISTFQIIVMVKLLVDIACSTSDRIVVLGEPLAILVLLSAVTVEKFLERKVLVRICLLNLGLVSRLLMLLVIKDVFADCEIVNLIRIDEASFVILWCILKRPDQCACPQALPHIDRLVFFLWLLVFLFLDDDLSEVSGWSFLIGCHWSPSLHFTFCGGDCI